MKFIFIQLLKGLFSSPQVAIKFKDGPLGSRTEHLVRTVNYIDKNQLNLIGKVIIDAGAANGDTCVYFSQLFPDHLILGFEPDKKLYDKAVRKAATYRNIRIQHVALADEEGNGHIHFTDNEHSESTYPLPDSMPAKNAAAKVMGKEEFHKAPIATLDKMYTAMQPVLLLKIDTKGSELSVLKGAIHTLTLTKLILVELNASGELNACSAYYEVDEFLRSRNFLLRDIIVTKRQDSGITAFDALYENTSVS